MTSVPDIALGHSLRGMLTSAASSRGWRQAWVSAAMVVALCAGSMSAGVPNAEHPVLASVACR